MEEAAVLIQYRLTKRRKPPPRHHGYVFGTFKAPSGSLARGYDGYAENFRGVTAASAIEFHNRISFQGIRNH